MLRWTCHRLFSFCRPLIPFDYTCCLIQMSSGIEMKSLAYGIIIFVPPYVQVKLMSSLGPSASLYVNEFNLFQNHLY